jgi:hypothetical protein
MKETNWVFASDSDVISLILAAGGTELELVKDTASLVAIKFIRNGVTFRLATSGMKQAETKDIVNENNDREGGRTDKGPGEHNHAEDGRFTDCPRCQYILDAVAERSINGAYIPIPPYNSRAGTGGRADSEIAPDAGAVGLRDTEEGTDR